MQAMELLIIILMLFLSAFFSGSEIAFVAANRLRVEVQAQRGGYVGRIVHGFTENPTTFLTTTLVGNNIALVVYSALMAFYLTEPLHGFYAQTVGLGEASLEVAVRSTQTVIAASVVLLIGETLPKSIMREVADRAVFVLALPLRATYYLLLPLVKLAGGTSSLLVRLLRADAAPFSQFPRRDFELLIEESRESGTLALDEEETEILSNVFDLYTMRVKESMTPRTDIVAVEENTSLEDLRQRCIETGYSKLPVYHENIDTIIGVVFAYDFFEEPASLQEMMRPAKFVPESKPSKDLLQEFLTANSSIAIVIDEYGGTAGLVTREDLLEELVGDIQDEFDSEDAVMRQIDAHTYDVSGRAEIDALDERFGLKLSEGDYETVAGYLLEHFGVIPAPQEEYDFEGYRFIILQATAHRIDLVRIVRKQGDDEQRKGFED